MAIKLDTVNLDEFLRLNPQLSEEERQEILALDTKKENTLDRRYARGEQVIFEPEIGHTVTDGHSHMPAWYDHSEDDADWQAPTILDKSEIRSFFKRFGITYSQYVNSYYTLNTRQQMPTAAAQPAWVASLEIYLFEHLSDDFLTAALGSNDLPLNPRVKLSENPRENLVHFLDFAETTYINNHEEPDDFFQAISSQHTAFAFRTLASDSYSPIGLVTIDENPLVMPNFNPDSLFWQTFNPFLKDKELAIEFEKAITKAVKILNPNAVTSGIMNPNYGNGECILFADLPQFFALVRSELENPSDILESAAKTDYVARAKNAGFILKSNAKKQFEDFITDPTFKEILDDYNEWPLQFKKEFLSFFQMPQVSFENIRFRGGFIFLTNSETTDSSFSDFSFQDILQANDYMILIADAQRIMMRNLETTTQAPSQMGLQAGTADQRIFTSHCQPINRQEWELLNSILAQAQDLQIFDGSRGQQIDTPLMAMRFLLAPDYITRIANNCPWITGLSNPQTATDVLDQFFADANGFVVPFGLAGSIIKSSQDLTTAIFLQALQKSKNPEIILSFMLYLGTLPGDIGNWVRQTFIPLVFSQIGFYDYDVDKDEDKNPHTLNIKQTRKALSNQWAKIEASDMPFLAENLPAFEAKDLLQVVAEIKFAPLTQLQNFGEHTQNQSVSIAKPETLQLGTRRAHVPGLIRIERILALVKLDSTKAELKKNFLAKGDMWLAELLNHHWPAAQREDLRQALAVYYFWTPRAEIKGIGAISGSADSKPQLELMSFQALTRLIRTSSIPKRAPLWEALFNKSPSLALQFYETTLVRTKANGFQTDGAYPSREDLVWATPFVIASHDPKASVILMKHRDYLETNNISASLADKLDGKTILDMELSHLLTSMPYSEVPLYVYTLFLEVENLFVSYHRIYGAVDEQYFAQLQAAHFSDTEIAYLKALTGEASTPLSQDTLSELIQLATQHQNGTKNQLHFLRLWHLVEEKFAGKLTPQNASAMAAYANTELTDGTFGIEDVANILKAIGETAMDHTTLPINVRVAAAALAMPWGFASLTEADLFEWGPDGGKQFKDNPELKSFLEHIVQDNHFVKIDGPLLGLARGKLYFPSSARIQLFANLLQKFGEYHMGPFATLKQDWLLAHFYPNIPTQPVDCGYDNPESEVYATLGHFSYLPAYDPVSLQIRKNWLTCYEAQPELLGDLTVNDTALQKIIYPQNVLTHDLMSLWRYDQVKYPQKITDADGSGFSPEEIKYYTDNVEQVYSAFLQNLKTFWQLKTTDYPLPENPDVFLKQIPKDGTQSPWFDYSILLVKAMYGDQEAINTLWQYDSGAQKLESDVAVFDKACKSLLAFGHALLMQVDPERFFTGSRLQNVAENSTLGMLELGHPDPSTPALKGHLRNPTLRTAAIPVDHVGHATMVAQTLLGNYQDASDASGQVKSYAVALEGSTWEALDAQFQQIVLDAQTDGSIKVINLSFGLFGLPAIGSDYDQLVASETYKSIQHSLAILRQMKIPVVVAAGNAGSEDNSILQGTLNWFAALDPAIILVGATNLAGTQSTAFSSKGTEEFRADISMVGEDLTFWSSDGGVAKNVDGTSFASPFTARIIAKMRDINPDLSVEAIQAILKKTAKDMAPNSPLVEGAGFIDAAACLYIAFVFGKPVSDADRKAFATMLGIPNSADLDWLAKRIERQVFWQDTTRQSYGE